MKFSKDMQVYRELQISAKEDLPDEEDPDELLFKPKIVTRVVTEPLELNESKIKFYRLQDLFTDYDSLTDQEKQTNEFRVLM